MQAPIIHPNWLRAPDGITDGFSLEMTAKDVPALIKAAPHIPPATPIAVTFLPGEAVEARIAATKAVRSLGFEPMPHFSARRLTSLEEFKSYLHQATSKPASSAASSSRGILRSPRVLSRTAPLSSPPANLNAPASLPSALAVTPTVIPT